MKQETTRKYARTLDLVNVRDAYYLLQPFDAVYYTAGIYGWNEDIYCIGGHWLTTGYRTTAKKSLNYDYVQEYNEKAKEIMRNRELSRETRKDKCYDLIVEMLENAKY